MSSEERAEEYAAEPFNVSELWLDGFSGVHVNEETLRCTAFSLRLDDEGSHPVAVVKLIMNARTARHFIRQMTEALIGKSAKARANRSRRKPG
jgi:hypothetical protein